MKKRDKKALRAMRDSCSEQEYRMDGKGIVMHSPEPWHVMRPESGPVLRDSTGHWPAEQLDANLERAALCVNACRRFDAEVLAEVNAGRAYLMAMAVFDRPVEDVLATQEILITHLREPDV